jgi:gamma-glutamyltranspeptidase/glutathione hydrolase
MRNASWRTATRNGLRVALAVAVLASCAITAQASEFRPGGWAEHGMVVSDSRLASEAGAEIIRDGGNAVDAAVTTAFTLAVTFPWAGNLAGGGFAVVRLANGELLTLDFRETAPAAAGRDMFLNEAGEVADSLSLYSHLAVGVPGSVDGLLRLWEDHGSGKISRERLLEPAVHFARQGFVIDQDLAERLNLERKRLAADAGAAAIFVRADGRRWKPGDLLVQLDLAATLSRIAKHGRAGFYDGPVAEELVKEIRDGNGVITREDLAAYRSVYREPVRGTFRGYDIVSMGPPSSGGALVVQILNMLEAAPLRDLGWSSADYVHLFVEAERRAYADRATHLGDPEFWDVPLAMLTSKDYAYQRMSDFQMTHATPSAEVRAGALPAGEPDETTHISAADAAGNAVSLTTTLNGGFGTCLVADGTGMLLNNEMDDFSAKPGTPNYYGLVGNEANAIAPGKRMLSSMSPTLVLQDGRPVLVLGSPGGSRIISSVVEVILNALVFEMPVVQAVAVPRVHHQWLPDELFMESFGLAPEVVRDLKARGHTVTVSTRSPIGRVNAIAILDDGLHGGPDVRGPSASAGY